MCLHQNILDTGADSNAVNTCRPKSSARSRQLAREESAGAESPEHDGSPESAGPSPENDTSAAAQDIVPDAPFSNQQEQLPVVQEEREDLPDVNEEQLMDAIYGNDFDSLQEGSGSPTGTADLTQLDFSAAADSILPGDWLAPNPHPQEEPKAEYLDVPSRHRQRMLHPNSVVYTYYPFLTLDNLFNCLPQDVDFLEAEGCFHLPTRVIMDQVVRQYFLHVHPLLPLFNEGDFWDMYYHKRPDRPQKMSLLVFQAITFVSCNVSAHSRWWAWVG